MSKATTEGEVRRVGRGGVVIVEVPLGRVQDRKIIRSANTRKLAKNRPKNSSEPGQEWRHGSVD